MRTEKKFVKTAYYPGIDRSIVAEQSTWPGPEVTNRAVFAQKDANVSWPRPHCARSVWKGTKFSMSLLSPRNHPMYLGRKTGCSADSLFKETWGLSVCSKRAARSPHRSPSTSAILMPGFFLNVLLLFQLPSLLPVTVVSVRPWRLKRARQQNFLRPLKVR